MSIALAATSAPIAEKHAEFRPTHTDEHTFGGTSSLDFQAAKAIMKAIKPFVGSSLAVANGSFEVPARDELILMSVAAGAESKIVLLGGGPQAQQIVAAAKKALEEREASAT